MGNIPSQGAAAGASTTTPPSTQPQREDGSPPPDQDRKEGNFIKIDTPKDWDENYRKFVKEPDNNKLVVVEFAAQWCGPSRFIAPFIDKQAEVHKDVTFLRVNFDMMEEKVTSDLGVDVVPTFLLYKGGELKSKIVGARRWEFSNEIQNYKKK